MVKKQSNEIKTSDLEGDNPIFKARIWAIQKMNYIITKLTEDFDKQGLTKERQKCANTIAYCMNVYNGLLSQHNTEQIIERIEKLEEQLHGKSTIITAYSEA